MAEFAKTRYLAEKVLNHNLLGETFTPPDQVYLALFTSDPGPEGDTSSEISDPAYERQLIEFTAAALDDVGEMYCENTLDIEFPQATTNWGDVTHGAIMDAQTGGNMLYVGAFDEEKQVKINDWYQVPAGQVRIKEV